MITITQFTLPQLRAAQQIINAKRPAPAAAAPKADAAEPAADQAPSEGGEETSGQAPEAPAQEAAPAAEAVPAGPAPELLAELAEKLPLAENKVPYMLGALKVAGSRVQKLRQVRVVQLEGAPANAIKADDAAYILDMLPDASPKGGKGGRTDSRDGNRKGGRGDGKGRGDKKPGDRRGPGGPGGGRGPGAGGAKPQGGRGPGSPRG